MRDPVSPLRKKLDLDPRQVRVVFEAEDPDKGGATRIPYLECEPCGELLRWESADRWWVCPACGFELTTDEAKKTVAEARRLVGVLDAYIDRKRGVLAPAVADAAPKKGLWRWLWVKLWGRPQANEASSSSSESG